MTNILFICHGNICRSPMAEFIFKDLINRKGCADRYYVESAATSTEELGNPIYPPAARELDANGVPYERRRARQIIKADYKKFDLIIAMDRYNLRNLRWTLGDDPQKKVRLLMDYTSRPGDVSDPWYTGDFRRAFEDIDEGCRGLLEELERGE